MVATLLGLCSLKDYQEQTLHSLHHNHFGILGSSPPGFKEGYLYISVFKRYDIRLVIKYKGFVCFCCVRYYQNEGDIFKGKGVSMLTEGFNR